MEDFVRNALNIFACTGFSIAGTVVVVGGWFQIRKRIKQQSAQKEEEKVTKIIW